MANDNRGLKVSDTSHHGSALFNVGAYEYIIRKIGAMMFCPISPTFYI